MSAIKDGRYPITLDKERHLLFSLNVIDEIQDKFGSIEKLGDAMMDGSTINAKNIKWLLTRLINEGAGENEEQITEEKVGKLLHAGNIISVQKDILAAISFGNSGTPESEEPDPDDDDEEDDEKNAQSGQEQ
jgi:hypothetical protein